MRIEPRAIVDWSAFPGARLILAGLIALVALVLLTRAAAAQHQQFAPPAASGEAAVPSGPPPQPTAKSRGLFESIGRWFDQGTAGFRSHLDSAKGRFDDLNYRATATSKNLGNTAIEVGKNAVDAGVTAADVTRDAVGTVAKLPLTRIVNGRERCMLAPNGAPDCLAAADALCRKNGFSTGKSLDFTSAEQCTAQAMLAGRQSEAECTTVTFISRAMCQ
jgi:hypothetical protein